VPMPIGGNCQDYDCSALIGLKCLPALQARPYLLKEEETYEPPEDPDSGM
jgi:hypothetical protein